METKNQNSNPLKTIKESFDTNVVKANLDAALHKIKLICEQKEYVVDGSIDKIISDLNLEKSTLTSRKKLAKKIYFFEKKQSRKTMSSLFSFIRKRFLGDEYRVSIKPSLLEQEMTALRIQYKKMYVETEAIRLAWKEKKKLFYSKNV